MRYLVKAILQKGLSLLPASDALNYRLQRAVTHTLPRPDADFLQKVRAAVTHLRTCLAQPGQPALRDAALYEFGAGADLIIPITYAFFGVRRQIVIDISPLVRPELLNDTIARLCRMHARIAALTDLPFTPRPLTLRSAADLEQHLGIAWRAPLDARRTGLPTGAFDFISNTATLEHIPAGEIPAILAECYRILAPGGLMSCLIDLQDHYSYSDARITPYHFLTHGDLAWAWLNSPLHFQNRLRYPEYLAFVRETPFRLLAEAPARATPTELDLLERLAIAPRFRRFSLEELGVKALWLTLQKPGDPAPPPR